MLKRSTLQLLRFHFSFFLLPVFLFGISELPSVNWSNAALAFIILHLLVYPASNGYNSYMDRDEGAIGGVKHPLKPTRQLYDVCLVMDTLAFVLSFAVSYLFALGILLYILASRAYSYRGIRLKQYPVIGFLTVFIFQGAWVFFITCLAAGNVGGFRIPVLSCVIASLLIGALYPLTQIFQHEDDLNDGVITISYVLGRKGTFVFSMLLFLTATFLLFIRFHYEHVNWFYLYLSVMLPVVLFFLYWMRKTWMNGAAANFKNSLIMNVLSTLCTTIFFILLIILKH